MIATRDPRLLTLGLLAIAILVWSILIIKAIIKALRGPKEERTPRTLTSLGRYEFNICDVMEKHRWFKVRKNEMVFNHSEGDREYKINTQNIYEIQPGILLKLRWKLKGITTGFIVVFSGDEPTPVSYEDPKRSAYVLKSVEESRALSNALKDEFKKALDIKNVFIYIVIGVVILVIYLALTGQLRV